MPNKNQLENLREVIKSNLYNFDIKNAPTTELMKYEIIHSKAGTRK